MEHPGVNSVKMHYGIYSPNLYFRSRTNVFLALTEEMKMFAFATFNT